MQFFFAGRQKCTAHLLFSKILQQIEACPFEKELFLKQLCMSSCLGAQDKKYGGTRLAFCKLFCIWSSLVNAGCKNSTGRSVNSPVKSVACVFPHKKALLSVSGGKRWEFLSQRARLSPCPPVSCVVRRHLLFLLALEGKYSSSS